MSSELDKADFPDLDSRYQFIEFLGEGTIGKTYLAEDTLRRQRVAIKLIHEDIVEDAGGFDGLRDKLNRLSSLSHPQIGRIFDFGLLNNQVYLITDIMTGRPLREWLSDKANASAPEKILHVIKQIARILVALEADLAHGGLKPENVWIDDQSTVRLSDYGFAGLASHQKRLAAATLLGCACFIPPEAFRKAQAPQAATDAFALGMIWRECLRSRGSKDPAHRSEMFVNGLTDVQAEKRIQALSQLARPLPARPRASDRSSLGGTGRSIVIAASILIILPLLAWTLHLLAKSGKPTSSAPLASVSTILARAQQVNQKRNALLEQALEAPKLASQIMHHLDGRLPLEVLWQAHESSLQSSSQSTPLSKLERRLSSHEQRIQQASNLIQVWRQISELQEELSLIQARSIVHTNLPLADWQAAQTALQSHLRAGDIRLTVQKASALESRLKNIRDTLWADSFLTCQKAKSDWTKALRSQQLDEVEPIEPPAKHLDQYRPHAANQTASQSISALETIAGTYRRWEEALDSIPAPKAQSFVNSLGMRFNDCGPFWASVWETRVLDFAAFVHESGSDMRRLWRERAATHSPLHPVVNVSRNDAADFCRWLTQRDLARGKISADQSYRLPTDLEWSLMAGLREPNDGRTPQERGWENPDHYPWGTLSIPLPERGNYFTPWDGAPENNYHQHDPFVTTAPVGQFSPNFFGLYDLGGNVWEWVSDGMHEATPHLIRRNGAVRGGGWRSFDLGEMKTEARQIHSQDHEEVGFRIVLASKNISTLEREDENDE